MHSASGRRHTITVFISLLASLTVFAIALIVAFAEKGWIGAFTTVLSSMVLEVLIGAAASVPLGFHPLTGAIVATLSNLAPAPILIVSFDVLVQRWKWLHKKLGKIERFSRRFEKYGLVGLALVSPFTGVYVACGVGITLRYRPFAILLALTLGTIATALVVTYGGHFIKHLFW